jgi:hypothetical protein
MDGASRLLAPVDDRDGRLPRGIYAVPTWTKTVTLVTEHAALTAVIAPTGDVPSVNSCHRSVKPRT